ncbi:putative transposase [Alteromonadaceae bacterium Bs31]|nr:putative transposase [Alteromonadaceae bacterium Bs31]
MVNGPDVYSWSSYQSDALGKKAGLKTPHPLYLALGKNTNTRLASYRELFRCQVEGKLLDDIRKAANKGLVMGNERFAEQVEALTGKTLKEGKRGRPFGWRITKEGCRCG